MDHDSPPPPSAPPQDDGDDIVVITYFFIFYFFVPLCLLLALIYYSLRDHLWELCCYYDVESAFESQQPPHQPADVRATTIPTRIITPCSFAHQTPPPNRFPSQPPAVGRLLRGSEATTPPERISGIAASFTECAICTGPLDEEGSGGEACTTLPLCGHRFHKVCVYHWLNRKATCPICRRFYPFPIRPKFKIFLNRK